MFKRRKKLGPQTLSEALQCLSESSLKNEEVALIREGKEDLDGDGIPDDPTPEEPEMRTRKEVKLWRKWAKDRAREHADTCHLRLQQKDGTAKKLPLRAKPNDLLEQLGIVPALFLDFKKFGGGYCLVGLLVAAGPSIVLSILNAQEAANKLTAEGDPTNLAGSPTFLLVGTIGTRDHCFTDLCQAINLVSAIAEVVFSIFLLLGTIQFLNRAHRLQAVNDANNVYTREYAVQLHGMPSNTTAKDIKEHIEHCLAAHKGERHKSEGGVRRHIIADEKKPFRVWDVALITNCSHVLRQALKQAPLERRYVSAQQQHSNSTALPSSTNTPSVLSPRRYTILVKRLATLKAFKKEKDTGWDINSRIRHCAETKDEMAEKLVEVRDNMSKKALRSVSTVCGAFITFEEQPAAQACLQLFGGST